LAKLFTSVERYRDISVRCCWAFSDSAHLQQQVGNWGLQRLTEAYGR